MRTLSPALGMEVDADLREPIDESFASALRDALDRHHLLLFRNQQLDAEDQVRVGSLFGEVTRKGGAELRGYGDVSFISNAHPQGRAGEGELMFHTDHIYFEKPVARVLTLYGVEVPSSGGQTMYSNAVRAHRELPGALKERIAPLHALHAHDYTTTTARNVRWRIRDIPDDQPRAVHPVALTHPRTKEKLLYVSERHTDSIVELAEEESEALLVELLAYLKRSDNIYSHTWQVGDLIVWDNFALQHARRDFDPAEHRTLRRVQVV